MFLGRLLGKNSGCVGRTKYSMTGALKEEYLKEIVSKSTDMFKLQSAGVIEYVHKQILNGTKRQSGEKKMGGFAEHLLCMKLFVFPLRITLCISSRNSRKVIIIK